MESPPVAACAAFAVFDIKSVERIKLGGHGLAPPISAAARTMARRVAERGFPSIRSSSNGTDPRSPTWTNTWLGELGRLRLNPIFIASRSASPSSSSGFHRMVGSAISALPSRSHSQIEYPAAFAAGSNNSRSVFLCLLVVMAFFHPFATQNTYAGRHHGFCGCVVHQLGLVLMARPLFFFFNGGIDHHAEHDDK